MDSILYGSRGSRVEGLQELLLKLGYYDGPIDGFYGDSTKKAVTHLQEKAGLNVTGNADSRTLTVLLIRSSRATEDDIRRAKEKQAELDGR